eukprot:scaffold5911_cov127-Isochrysis_galbana.AAC.4
MADEQSQLKSPVCLSDDLLCALVDALADSLDSCVAFASTCRSVHAAAAPRLAQLGRESVAAAGLRPWSDPSLPSWTFTAHIKRGVAAPWRGCWNLHVGADRRCVLAHRAAPSATKETRWYGRVLDWVHTKHCQRESVSGGVIATFSQAAFSVPFQLPWRVRRHVHTRVTGFASAGASATGRRLLPPEGATQWLLCEDGTLLMGSCARLDLTIPPPGGELLSAAALGLFVDKAWNQEGVEVNWLETMGDAMNG